MPVPATDMDRTRGRDGAARPVGKEHALRRTLALATLAAALAVPVLPATAGEPGGHCVIRLVATGPGTTKGAVAADPVVESCHDTLEQALEAGLGTPLELDPTASPATLSEQDLAAASGDGISTTSSDVLLGIEYNEYNYLGASASYYASSGCQNTTWEVAYVGNDWNDMFESGKGFGACDRNRKFEHSNFGGQSKLCTPNCSDYGYLRNRVSSLRWRD